MDAGPATALVAVTKSDSVPLPTTSRAIYVGTTGDVTVKGGSGAPVLFKAVPAGSLIPIAVTYIMSTGTTAADFVALL